MADIPWTEAQAQSLRDLMSQKAVGEPALAHLSALSVDQVKALLVSSEHGLPRHFYSHDIMVHAGRRLIHRLQGLLDVSAPGVGLQHSAPPS